MKEDVQIGHTIEPQFSVADCWCWELTVFNFCFNTKIEKVLNKKNGKKTKLFICSINNFNPLKLLDSFYLISL